MIEISVFDSNSDIVCKKEFSRFPIIVGRQNDCDLHIADRSVSGRHAIIEKTEGQLVLRDLNSSNGLYLNKRRLLEEPLPFGEYIRIGRMQIRVENKTEEIKPLPLAPETNNAEVREFFHRTNTINLRVNHKWLDQAIIFLGRYAALFAITFLLLHVMMEMLFLDRGWAVLIEKIAVQVGVTFFVAMSFIAFHFHVANSFRWRLYFAICSVLLLPAFTMSAFFDYFLFFGTNSKLGQGMEPVLYVTGFTTTLYSCFYVTLHAIKNVRLTHNFIKFGYLAMFAFLLVVNSLVIFSQDVRGPVLREMNNNLFLPLSDRVQAGSSAVFLQRLNYLKENLDK